MRAVVNAHNGGGASERLIAKRVVFAKKEKNGRRLMITRMFVLVLFVAALTGFAIPGRARFLPDNIEGISNCGSTVCIQDASGTIVSNPCAVTDAMGNFVLMGGTFPNKGDLLVYNVDCPGNGLIVRLGPNGTGTGGSWLNVSCKACVPQPSGMVDWWPFDETSGTTANDITGNSNNFGIYKGSPLPAPQVGQLVANSLCFNPGGPPSAGYVEVPDHPEINFPGDCAFDSGAPFTIDLWARTKASGLQVILDKRTAVPIQGYHMFIFNGRLGFQMASGGLFTNYIVPLTTPLINDGQWHFVAVTVARCRPSQGTLYVDGNPPFKFTPRVGSMVNTANLQIGRRDPAPGLGGAIYFNGCMDELEFYDRALSQAELRAIFAAGPFGKCKRPAC
jgi:hypothetical protein